MLVSAVSPAKHYEGVLGDPVALGAWLYQGHCLKCHGGYAEERLAEAYDDESDLADAVGSGGCSISWARNNGGPLGHTEIKGLVEYMLTWEEDGAAPDLPELPPQPQKKVVSPHTKPANEHKQAAVPDEYAEAQLPPALKRVLESNLTAQGGYLYTGNCYRCHLTYLQARMGRGLSEETLNRTISEGKTSTQMKPFSRMLGGDLKNSEIKAITTYILAWEEAGEPLAIAAELMRPPALDPADFVPIRLTRYKIVSGDAAVGSRLYRLNCMGCHGAGGEGRIGTSLVEKKWVLRPDLFFKSVVKKGIPGSLMKGWDSNAGGSFSAKDVDDLVAYLTGPEASAE